MCGMGDMHEKNCRDKSQLQEIVAVVVKNMLKSQFTMNGSGNTTDAHASHAAIGKCARHDEKAGERAAANVFIYFIIFFRCDLRREKRMAARVMVARGWECVRVCHMSPK